MRSVHLNYNFLKIVGYIYSEIKYMASKFSTTLQNLPHFFKYAFVVLVVMFISYLFPNNAKFKYEFQNGQSWRYDDLYAPFEFAILKPVDQVTSEIEALKSDFSPFYEMKGVIQSEEKTAFREAFNRQLESVKDEGLYKNVLNRPDRYVNYGYRIIDYIYDAGIIQLDSQHLSKENLFVINLRKGNTTQQRTLQSFLTNEKIETIVTDSLFKSGLKEAEFLIPLLKNNFRPNVFYSPELTQKFLDDQLATVSGAKGMVRKDELIVQKDGVITDDIYQKLLSYKAKYEQEISSKKSHLGVLLGYILLTSLIIGVFILYLRFHAKKVFDRIRCFRGNLKVQFDEFGCIRQVFNLYRYKAGAGNVGIGSHVDMELHTGIRLQGRDAEKVIRNSDCVDFDSSS